MRKLKVIVLVILVTGLLAAAAFFLFRLVRPKKAAILIESNPVSSVFVNGEQVGRTPEEMRLEPGEITLKLVPESLEKPLSPYETKVTLTPGIKTVVRRTFGDSEETSSGEVISFERVGSDEASLSVVSQPDTSQVSLDDQVRGFTPLKISRISSGEHKLTLSSSGYLERSFSIETVNAYRLTAIVKLAVGSEPGPEVSISPTVTPSEEKGKKIKEEEVEILSTPTGFLRVRKEPSTLADEITRVKPGEKYKLLETDAKTGWFKIEVNKDTSGWVTNQYAKKIGEATPTPSPKVTSTPKPTATKTPTPKPSPTPTY